MYLIYLHFLPVLKNQVGMNPVQHLTLVPATLNLFAVIIPPNSENNPYEEAIIGSSSFYK